ncbi:MAG TPA: glutathione S-transferase family protein [Sphingomonadaceae bacterium]|jgi:glutathione S-transferase|nr:glutathione S-transferase family protein [Sphingomonadaceae bacterium]
MTDGRTITLYHSPQTRSSAALTLLEELGVPYELKVLNMKAGEQRRADYLAVNPMGKVPAIFDGEVLVTEQVAIFIHLADRFPEAGLAPALSDPQRGAYLRWLAYYAGCFEPAVVDRFLQHTPPADHSVHRDFETMLGILEAQLAKGPYLLGLEITAADILWGTALRWTMMFGIVPQRPVFTAYVDRIGARAAVRKIEALDVTLAAEHEAASGTTAAEAA